MNPVQPMFSAENEQCVIGALLRDNNAVDFLGDLKAEHFFIDDHRSLFAVAMRMISAGHGCDAITLAEDMPPRRDGDEWLAMIGEIVANTPSSRNIGRYAKIVVDRATERALILAADQIAVIANSPMPTAEKVDQAQSTVMALADGVATKEPRNISSILTGIVQLVQDGIEGKIVRRLSPWRDIDQRTDLLTPGDLIIIGGRPAMGKTSFVMNLVEHVAIDRPVVVFSQEMSDEQLGLRMVSSVGRIELDRLIRNHAALTSEDLDRMSVAADKISRMKLNIDDQPARSLHQVRTYSRSVKRKQGDLGLIVIDYLQLMSGDSKDGRTEEISKISRGLKVLAKELQVPVVALSQLSRKCEDRPNKRPIMSDIRESGQIEQDADIIAFIYRDEIYNPDTPDKGIAEIIFGKLRMGMVGTTALVFNGHHSRFDNLSREWAPAPPPEKKTRGFN